MTEIKKQPKTCSVPFWATGRASTPLRNDSGHRTPPWAAPSGNPKRVATESTHSSLEYDLGPWSDYDPPNQLLEWQNELEVRMNQGYCDAFGEITSDEAMSDGDRPTAFPSARCNVPYSEVCILQDPIKLDHLVLAVRQQEIIAALHADGAPAIAGVDAREATRAIDEQYAALSQFEKSTMRTWSGIQHARDRLQERSEQLGRVSDAVEIIVSREDQHVAQRRQGIYKYMAQHLTDVKRRAEEASQEAFTTTMHLADLLAEEKKLEDALTEQARRIGIDGIRGPNDIEHAIAHVLNGEPYDIGQVESPEDDFF